MKRYNLQSPFSGIKTEYINNSVQLMYKFEASLTNTEVLLNTTEQTDFYLMLMGSLPSEIGLTRVY